MNEDGKGKEKGRTKESYNGKEKESYKGKKEKSGEKTEK